MAENQNNLYQSKSAIANKFLNPNGETSTLDEIITQVVPGATSAETTSTPTKEYQSKSAVANKFLNADGTYSTLDEILGRTIDGIGQFDVEVVEELPEVGEKGILYLVPNEGSGRDIYDEYVWIPSTESFEKIGTTEIDLSNYEQLTNKVTTITSDSTDTQYPSARAVKTYFGDNQLITRLSEIVYLDDGDDTPYYLDIDGETKIPLEAGKFFMLLFGGLVVNGTADDTFSNGTVVYDGNGYIQLTPPNMMVDGITQKGYYYENGEWAEDEYSKQQLENVLNKTTTIDANSTDVEYPSAHAVYNALAGKPGSADVIKVANAYAYGTNNSPVPVLYKNGVETPMVEGQWYLVESFTAPLTSRPIDEPTIVRYYISSLTNIPTVIKLSATVDANHGNAANWYTTYTYENNEWIMHVFNALESSFNKTTSVSDLSTDDQYPSAKAVYDSLPVNFTGTDGTTAGANGLVPAPTASDADKYLKSDGTWATVSGGGATYTAGPGIDITNDEISTVTEDLFLNGDPTWLTPGTYSITDSSEVAKLEELETMIVDGRNPRLGFTLGGAHAIVEITHFERDSYFFWLNGLWYTDYMSIGTIGVKVLRQEVNDTNEWSITTESIGSGGGGSSYTAGANIDITNDVISVDGILPGTIYTSLTNWTNGQYYQNVEAYEQLPEPTQNANAKTLTYQNTSFDDTKVTFRITGKCTDYMIIMYDGSMVEQVDGYNETKTNYIYTVDNLRPYGSIIFNFTNTDTNPPSVEIVTETGALRDYFEKKVDKDGNKTALSLGVERASNVIGENSIAQGHAGYAVGVSSCAFCSGTASGSYSFTAGGRATGAFSNAIGSSTEASGSNSTAIGQNASASGKNSIAFGYYTAANTAYQQVEGKFNILDTDGSTTTQGTYAHIVGNGTGVSASKRSNAYTLDWSGNAWFAGDVYVGSTGGKNKDAGSKKLATEDYVNTAIGNAMSASY